MIMSVKESMKEKLVPRAGKSFGLCKICGNQFKLKRKTKHKHDKVLSGVTCPECGKPKKPDMKNPMVNE